MRNKAQTEKVICLKNDAEKRLWGVVTGTIAYGTA